MKVFIFLNYRFYLKRIGKQSACFRCSGRTCNVKISFKTQIVRTNGVDCSNKWSRLFEQFESLVKDKVVENPLVSTQQHYETERNKQVSNMTAKKETPITMPNCSTIRDRFIKF